MQRSTERIYTTHVGSLPRPAALLDLMKAGADGQAVDAEEVAATEREAVREVVDRQRAAGLDVISDGEMSKTGFFAYIGQRLGGFEPRPGRSSVSRFQAEINAFPEYYEEYLKRAMTGSSAVPGVPLACTGPVSYTGRDRLRQDLENLRAAVGDAGPDEVFVPAVAPGGVGGNEYYPSQAAYLDAVADALRVEYLAIVDAAGRRPLPERGLQLLHRPRGGADSGGGTERRGDQPGAAGPPGAGAAAHLLRHQRGAPRL
jgi:5-methyltetrahydropteroyltriglutamate--homocysteine methyltransferase